MKPVVSIVGKLVITLICLSAVLAAEDQYEIGPEDILEIRYWPDQVLNTEVRVSLDGTITLDVIGRVEAVGKTAQKLQDDIARQMSRLNKKISQAVVRVTEFNYLYLFVSGEVNAGGKYSFEQIPDLWTIINEAGGVAETGDLSRVTIVRGGEHAGKVEVVDVAGAIVRGEIDKLPRIRRQDTIEIPASAAGLPTSELGDRIGQKNLIYAIGAVNRPGPVKFEEDTDLLEALALAGGPTSAADLSQVKVITRDGHYAQTISIDLEKYSRSGTMVRYIMRREDTFVVPTKSGGDFFGASLGRLATIAGILTSGILLFERLSD